MKEIIKFLNDAKVFYLATVDNDRPKVRPFGFVMEFTKKMYFVTANTKRVYAELKENPFIEICALGADRRWIRVSGQAVFEDNLKAKKKAFKLMPDLANIYNTPENPAFEVFYIEEGKADIYGGAEVKTLQF